jgi:D-inositol-3-phosphate glycosyltransferase
VPSGLKDPADLSQPPTLVTAASYTRDHLQFGNADQFGAQVAQHDLLQAALQFTPAQVHFYTTFTTQPTSLSARPAGDEVNSIEQLKRSFPGRVETSRVDDSQRLLERCCPIYLAGGPEFWPIGQLRQRLDGILPICSVLHSSNWPNLLLSYTSVLLSAEPYDVLVATSRAGEAVVERALESSRRFLRDRLGLDAFAVDRLRVPVTRIPLAVDDKFLAPRNREECRNLLGLPQDAVVLLYLGRLSEQYKADLDPLVNVFSRVAAGRSNLILLIAGQDTGGTYAASLGRLAAALGVAEKVIILPNFAHFLKPVFYSAADIFVSPSDNIQETFGLSILEAMASGLPVVASDWSGYRDLVVHEETGFLIRTCWNMRAGECVSAFGPLDPGFTREHYLAQRTLLDMEEMEGAFRRLIDDERLRRSLGNQGCDRVRRLFSWNTVIRRYYDLWEHQLSISARHHRDGNRSPWVDYNDLYAHFASASIEGPLSVVCADPAAVRQSVQKYPPRYASRTLRNHVAQVASRCGPFPLAPYDLRGCGTEDQIEAAMAWMLKRGLCRVGGRARVVPQAGEGQPADVIAGDSIEARAK